jgi:hypothetical protein
VLICFCVSLSKTCTVVVPSEPESDTLDTGNKWQPLIANSYIILCISARHHIGKFNAFQFDAVADPLNDRNLNFPFLFVVVGASPTVVRRRRSPESFRS